ncbi:MAG TPA: lysylphosphatidylglycerol synthase transmembrane domain-containing protein [Polyangiaceae bacterium]|nr:lysylphosphatidylglycerol synthase transmembrane domain-containing protein [Polyangiaceae bacterium]
MSSPALEAKLPRQARLRSIGPKLALSLLIAAGLVWVLEHGGLPILPPNDKLARVSLIGLAPYLLLCCLATYLRTYRWLYLLRPIAPHVSAQRVFGMGLIGFAAIFFAPLRTGELVRPWLIAEDGEVTFLQAAGTIAAERVIDGFVLMWLTLASLLLSQRLTPLPNHVGKLPLPIAAVPAMIYASCAMFSVALVLMILFYRWRAPAHRIVHAMLAVVSIRFADWATMRVERLSDGFKFLPALRQSGAFLRDTLFYWLSMIAATWALLKACGLHANVTQAGVVLGVMGLGSLIPSGPGFFGTYQLATYCGLATFFVETLVLGEGAVFTFVSYSVTLLLTVVSFLVGMVLLARTKPRAAGAP